MMRFSLLLVLSMLCTLVSLRAQEPRGVLEDYPLGSPELREIIMGNEVSIIEEASSELLRIDPMENLKRYAGLRSLMAFSYFSMSRTDSAMTQLTWLEDPAYNEVQYPERMIGLFVKGILQMEGGQKSEAYETYKKGEEIAIAYRDKFNQTIVKSYMGLALYANGLEREGFALLGSAIDTLESMGHTSRAYNLQGNLAAFYIRSGSYDSALVILNKIMNLPPNSVPAEFLSFSYSNAALCHVRLGQLELAKELIDKGEQLASESHFLLGELYSSNIRANYFLELGDWINAEAWLAKIQRTDTLQILQRATDLRSYNALITARYHEYLDEYELARTKYVEASKYATPGSKFPDFTAAYEGLHRVALSTGDLVEAKRIFATLNHLRDSLHIKGNETGLRLNKANQLLEAQQMKLEAQQRELRAETLARQRLLGALIGLCLLFMIFFLIFRNRNIKREREKTEATNLKLSEYTKELEELAFVVSHNLRESARNISTYTGLFSREVSGDLSQKGKTYLNFMNQASVRTSDMLVDLETYVGIGNHLPEGRPINLNKIWDAVFNSKKTELEQLDIKLKKDVLPSMKGHPDTLHLLFSQLLDNSIKYRKGNELEITISHHVDGTCHVIQFSDNGIGFSEVYKEKVFRVFQRLHTHEDIPGTGIGLPVVDKITRLYGGKVEVESEEGDGTTFTMRIPADRMIL